MDDLVIKKYVESFLSDEVNNEYLEEYLNNYEIQKRCDEMISKMLKNDISNKNYNIDKYLNYLNNVVSKLINTKPYLLELNVITKTINELIEKNKSEYYVKDENLKEEEILENSRLIQALAGVYEGFTYKYDYNFEAEKLLAEKYIEKLKKNENLSKNEVEELLSFDLCSSFSYVLGNNINYSDLINEYALKMIIRNNYKIDGFLYKNLLMHFFNNELSKISANDIKILFSYDKRSNYNMQCIHEQKNDECAIVINNEKFINSNPFKNFISFFHELTHYEQYNPNELNITTFLIAKDMFLRRFPDNKYYEANYQDLSFEKDAIYKSYIKACEFFKNTFPEFLPKLKKEIYQYLIVNMSFERKNISDRYYNGKFEDINVLFDQVVKDNKDKFQKAIFMNIMSPLVIEYDIRGNKRSIFDLLEDKKFREENGITERVLITNYLLYEESVSFEYILENLKLLESDEIKRKYSEFIPEVKQILKHKLLRYYANYFSRKAGKSEITSITKFYDNLAERLRVLNIKGLNKDKNIELYRKKEDELRIAYKWLYTLASEVEEEMASKIIIEDKKR